MPTTTGDLYRLYARECLRWADDTKSEEQRQLYLDMAKSWREVALATDGRAADGEHPLVLGAQRKR